MKYPVIFEANRPMLTDPDKIYPGQMLRIPPLNELKQSKWRFAMPSLLESLTGEMLGGDTIGQLSKAIGADERCDRQGTLRCAARMLLGGLAKNR